MDEETGKALQIEVRDIDHLGIVAGIIDEIGLVEEMIASSASCLRSV
jgi:hypothetical protein